jgi:peroxiredoxin
MSSAALADPPAVGTVAPDFTLPSTSGKPIQLSKLRKAGPVVLAFYPKAFTGG